MSDFEKFNLEEWKRRYMERDRDLGRTAIAICVLLALYLIACFICILNGTPMK